MEGIQLLNFILTCIVCIALANCDCDLSEFEKNGIVPDYVPQTPKSPLQVEFDGQSINCGSSVARTTVLTKPALNYTVHNDTLYTAIMFDPDAQLVGPFLHWLVENIPGTDVTRGDTVSLYFPPFPPPLLGAHRYTFLVYKQSSESDDSGILHKLLYNFDRAYFNLRDFAANHNLHGPIAGNFFYVGE